MSGIRNIFSGWRDRTRGKNDRNRLLLTGRKPRSATETRRASCGGHPQREFARHQASKSARPSRRRTYFTSTMNFCPLPVRARYVCNLHCCTHAYERMARQISREQRKRLCTVIVPSPYRRRSSPPRSVLRAPGASVADQTSHRKRTPYTRPSYRGVLCGTKSVSRATQETVIISLTLSTTAFLLHVRYCVRSWPHSWQVKRSVTVWNGLSRLDVTLQSRATVPSEERKIDSMTDSNQQVSRNSKIVSAFSAQLKQM